MTLACRSPAATLAVALLVSACAAVPSPTGTDAAAYAQPVQGRSVLRRAAYDRGIEDAILALDPENVSERDVRDVLAAGPTPRIVGIHGGIYPVHLVMESFGRFLIDMGYPESRVRSVRAGELSISPYEDGEQIAGMVAWYYEREAVRPLLIGHSQGGMQTVKVLHILAGKQGDRIAVYNPVTGATENRHEIVDPFTGELRPVVGLRLPYASVVGAGGAATLLPNQWIMAGRLRSVPDSVEQFTGYTIPFDPIAWDAPGLPGYAANGLADVRNVRLPASTSHVFAATSAHLAADPRMRHWINAYAPDRADALPPVPEGDSMNILWAADVWYSIKKHWVLEAQRLIRARRALVAEAR
jgi:hypothetical protein